MTFISMTFKVEVCINTCTYYERLIVFVYVFANILHYIVVLSSLKEHYFGDESQGEKGCDWSSA